MKSVLMKTEFSLEYALMWPVFYNVIQNGQSTKMMQSWTEICYCKLYNQL